MGQNVRCYHRVDTHSRHRDRTQKLVFIVTSLNTRRLWKSPRAAHRFGQQLRRNTRKVCIRSFVVPSEAQSCRRSRYRGPYSSFKIDHPVRHQRQTNSSEGTPTVSLLVSPESFQTCPTTINGRIDSTAPLCLNEIGRAETAVQQSHLLAKDLPLLQVEGLRR
jgi:hypothetical protein